MTAIAMNADDLRAVDDDGMRVRIARVALGAAALAAAAAGVWGVFRITGDHPVARLRIEGTLQRVAVEEIETAVRPYLETRFVDVDLRVVHQAVERLPWVARVRVERVWPATVRLRLWEREPAAFWGKDRLLDSNANEFAPAGRDVPATLPRLSGPEGSAAEVLTTFRQLSASLQDTPFDLVGLARDARGDWSGHTATGIELRFGRSDPARALDSLRGPAAEALAARIDAVQYVDLRYTNGFSVGWREPAAGLKRK